MMNMNGAPPAPGMPGMMPPPQPVDPLKLEKAQELLLKPTWDDVIALFRNDRLRSFRLDIETDSTISADEQSEKQAVSEFFTNVGSFLGSMLPVVQQAPELMPLAMEMLKYGARRFEAGRTMETTIDEVADRLQERMSKTAGQQQPDPQIVAAQIKAQAMTVKTQAELQIAQQRSQSEVALKGQEAQADMGLRQAQAVADAQLESAKAQADAQVAAMKAMSQPRPM